ncbi:MarR family transcriptional regulator [endosymbiont 'TC1' of Trimyema compressum]|nr:MarR family transcriptional regulator [endosymbiont 'TC1' of Trimyema compressum]
MDKIMNVTSSSITQLINGLEENDFITKTINKKDRRSIYIKLSKKVIYF